jgi:hypothetical protein
MKHAFLPVAASAAALSLALVVVAEFLEPAPASRTEENPQQLRPVQSEGAPARVEISGDRP